MEAVTNGQAKGRSAADRALLAALGDDAGYLDRFKRIAQLSRTVRATEYLLTNACNIRCKGCWFFEHGFDTKTKDLRSLDEVKSFVRRERERGVNYALIIGGEPTLVLDRVALFVEQMDYVTISTNGLRPLPRQGFERVAAYVSLFGGGPLDDDLRAIKPGGKRFTGLFDEALRNYRDDPRACFVYAVTEDGVEHIEPTIRRIRDNGNRVTINFYSKYDQSEPLRMAHGQRLLEEVLRVRELYSDTVLSHPYFLRTIITGESHWDKFGYHVCPSISVDNKVHEARLANGNPVLPKFNAWAADCATVNFCCTSGHCEDCRDSQAVLSWLMVSVGHFRETPERFKTWIEVAESYWNQFVWAMNVVPAQRPRRALPLVSEFAGE